MDKKEKISVLIAEDDEEQNNMLREGLEMEDDIVCCAQAKDGVEALEAVKKYKPAVLILDILMPRMDGLDLLRGLKNIPAGERPRTIVLSAFSQRNYVIQALTLGADFYLMKPYQIDCIADRVRMAVSNQHSLPDLLLESNILMILTKIGAPTNTLGFNYLQEALAILAKNPNLNVLSKDVYRPIAEQNNTTEPCVEKAIRKAIDHIIAIHSPELCRLLEKGCLSEQKRISNSQFLTLTAQEIRYKVLLKGTIWE